MRSMMIIAAAASTAKGSIARKSALLTANAP
jgi:hypothetical protein